MNMEITIPQDNPVWLLSARLEELDYRELTAPVLSQEENRRPKTRILFEVLVYGYMRGIYPIRKLR